MSFGALGHFYLSHLRGVLQLQPAVRVVVHVRSNHVKQALSFLRTTCDGELNHMTQADLASKRAKHKEEYTRLHVPPSLLLLRASNAASEQSKILADAESVSGNHVAYIVRYEALQIDLRGEMRKLLLAVGVQPAAAAASVAAAFTAPAPGAAAARDGASSTSSLPIKAGVEHPEQGLSNFGEIAAYLLPLPCLHGMAAAAGPTLFPLKACARELSDLPPAMVLDMQAARASRGRLELNATECGQVEDQH